MADSNISICFLRRQMVIKPAAQLSEEEISMIESIREMSFEEVESVVGGNCEPKAVGCTKVRCDSNGENCTSWHGTCWITVCSG